MSAIRFRPPRVVLSPECGWVLRAAFGPVERLDGTPLDGAAAASAAALAVSLELAPRIASRLGSVRLRRQLGGSAGALVGSRGVAALSADRILAAARAVAEVAAARRIPVAFLKGVALHLAAAVAPGERAMADVDVLANPPEAQALRSALLASRFAPLGGIERGEHELPNVVSADGIVVDIHRHVPGIRFPGEPGFASLASLAARNDVVKVAGWPGEPSIPAPRVLVAHALVHGILQCGFSPRSYPFLRLVADLIDLGVARPEGEDLLRRALADAGGEIRTEEGAATRRLCAALAASLEPAPGSPESDLLAHALAGALDDRYRRWLALRAVVGGPSLRPGPLALVAGVRRAVFIGGPEARAIYGPARYAWGGPVRRLTRPFDLLRRLGGAFRARRELRRSEPILVGAGTVPGVTGSGGLGQ